MKIIQEIIFGVILFSVFRKWWREEHKGENADEITQQSLREYQVFHNNTSINSEK